MAGCAPGSYSLLGRGGLSVVVRTLSLAVVGILMTPVAVPARFPEASFVSDTAHDVVTAVFAMGIFDDHCGDRYGGVSFGVHSGSSCWMSISSMCNS